MIIESPDIIKNPIVSVVVITYKQEKYITQCIDAILSQQTNFPFEVIISDDCSPDKTPEICKEYQRRYPNKIRLLLQDENRGVARNFGDALALARGKYIASMAGDDYWVCEEKIQIQKDYLDAHPRCGLCYTNINTCDEEGNILETEYMNKYPRSNSFVEHIENRGYIAPLTWMYRRNLLNEYTIEGAQTDESFAFALDAFATSEVSYLDIVTANYRLTTNSLSRQDDPVKSYRQWLGVFKTQNYYLKKYRNLVDEMKCMQIRTNGYIEFLPMAYQYGDDHFINEVKEYFKSIGINIDPYINTCKARKSAEQARKSLSYRLGKALLKPFNWLKKIARK